MHAGRQHTHDPIAGRSVNRIRRCSVCQMNGSFSGQPPPHLHVLIIVRTDALPRIKGILVAIKQPAEPAEARGLF